MGELGEGAEEGSELKISILNFKLAYDMFI
jgi:hypothetical protein